MFLQILVNASSIANVNILAVNVVLVVTVHVLFPNPRQHPRRANRRVLRMSTCVNCIW
jgi:hypothetical protein